MISPWDHPRICGEHRFAGWSTLQLRGSSPHMRGTPNSDGIARRADGIIPAYAGNTNVGQYRDLRGGDHPRICGEHLNLRVGAGLPVGSSPHMRGTHECAKSVLLVLGIIPAYAGNTSTPSETPPAHRDHPRICGEHYATRLAIADRAGSSPHMRGTLCPSYFAVQPHGIIPAYAGNTLGRARLPRPGRDHPRICGEH